jgi:hypothetical protein
MAAFGGPRELSQLDLVGRASIVEPRPRGNRCPLQPNPPTAAPWTLARRDERPCRFTTTLTRWKTNSSANLGLLLLDERGSGTGTDRLPADSSVSSEAGVTERMGGLSSSRTVSPTTTSASRKRSSELPGTRSCRSISRPSASTSPRRPCSGASSGSPLRFQPDASKWAQSRSAAPTASWRRSRRWPARSARCQRRSRRTSSAAAWMPRRLRRAGCRPDSSRAPTWRRRGSRGPGVDRPTWPSSSGPTSYVQAALRWHRHPRRHPAEGALACPAGYRRGNAPWRAQRDASVLAGRGVPVRIYVPYGGRLVPLRDAPLGRVSGLIKPQSAARQLATLRNSPARSGRRRANTRLADELKLCRSHRRRTARVRSPPRSIGLAPQTR